MLERHYAEEICYGLKAGNSDILRQAFARVRKENFLFPPPWATISNLPGRNRAKIETSDTRDLYHDILVELVPEDNINSGQPSLWAHILHWSDIQEGMRAFQSGAGLGYYTALLAQIVGEAGHVYFHEPHVRLEGACLNNLRQTPNATNQFRGEELHRVYFFYGTTCIPVHLYECLCVGGKLIVPLTDENGRGRFVSLTKTDQGCNIETGCHCYFVTSRSYRANPAIAKIASLESIFLEHAAMKAATIGHEIDLVMAICNMLEV